MLIYIVVADFNTATESYRHRFYIYRNVFTRFAYTDDI